jgi:hypothetical protein
MVFVKFLFRLEEEGGDHQKIAEYVIRINVVLGQ